MASCASTPLRSHLLALLPLPGRCCLLSGVQVSTEVDAHLSHDTAVGGWLAGWQRMCGVGGAHNAAAAAAGAGRPPMMRRFPWVSLPDPPPLSLCPSLPVSCLPAAAGHLRQGAAPG